MNHEELKALGRVFRKHEKALYDAWIANQLAAGNFRPDLMKEAQLREQSQRFLDVLLAALDRGFDGDLGSGAGSDVGDFLAELSRARAVAGFSYTETATFVFSLKQPAFDILGTEYASNVKGLTTALWNATLLLDKLGLYTTEVYTQSREDIISRQQRELLELSTPVVQLWDDILAVPLVGTLDSSRAQVVMETLLQRIVDTGAAITIIDITGVPTVDTLVAQHLLKTIAATRLMGADCIISGIRPQIAQTIVHLGVELGEVVTKATLADAFAVALKRIQAKIDAPR